MLEKLWERWYLVPISPGMEVVVAALIICGAALLFRNRFKASEGLQSRPTPGLRLTAAAVLLAWIAGTAFRLLATGPWEVYWWQYALPLGVATIGMVLTMVAAPSRARRTGAPAGVGLRRTWTSFTRRVDLGILVAVASLLIVITIACGIASSPDDNGQYSILVIDGGGRASFYGWAYGIPVLVAMVALLVVLWITLYRIAVPPFANPSIVELETAQRYAASTATVWVSGSALLLTLGAIVNSIGYTGSGSSGVGIPGVGDFMWRAGFASFSEFFIWSGWALEVSACVGLIALALGFVPGKILNTGTVHETAKAGAL